MFAVVSVEYTAMSTLFSVVPSHLQWILAFPLPIMKFINEWFLTKIAYRASGKANYFAKFCVTFSIGCMHALFLALTVGYVATNTTSNLILALDITCNLMICVRAVRLKQKSTNENRNENMEIVKELVLELVLIEIIECFIPLVYCITLLIAYYGPNADIMGGIKNDYWQYEKIDNVWIPLKQIALLFFIDMLSIAISSVLLWEFCRINTLKIYCHVVKKFWILMSVWVAETIVEVRFCC